MKKRLNDRKGHLVLRGGASTLVLIVLGVWLGATSSSGSSASGSAATTLGVYAGSGDVGGVNALGQAIGRQPKYAMEFLDGRSWDSISNPSYFTSEWQDSGYSMIWGVPMLPNSGATLAQGATGAYNQYFVTLADNFVAAGQGSSIMRIGWEFNGGWFPWAANGQASNFVAYWQQIVTAMRSVPGANFQFEWNPTRGDLGVGNLADYYPGDAYVDLIGMDVYDTEWANYPGAAAQFASMETQTYGLNWLASFAGAHDKPITFPEWGLGWGPSNSGGPVSEANQQVSGGDNPTFINDMANWIATHNVLEATFWDYGTSSVASGANPNTLAALGQDFGSGAPAPTTTTTATPTTPPPPPPPPPPPWPPTTTTTAPPPPTTTTTAPPPPTTTTTAPPPPPTTTTTTTVPVHSASASTTTLAASDNSANYGAEGTTQFTVSVSPAVTGPVKVNSPWTVCTATVTAGTGTCSLSNNNLNVGSYSVTAVYAGGNGVTGSTSASVPFTVNLRPVVLTTSVTPASVSYGSEGSVAVNAHVTVPTGGIATGTVDVTSGSTPVCTITLSVGSGSCSPGRVAFDAGTHPLVSTYTGDMSDAAAVTPSASLVVTGPRVYWPLAWLRMERLYLSHIGEATHWDAWLLFVNRV